tara:strand:- start:137 stop:319 length:183 start_codon:yes stop_codon:yes gene_type:complete
MKLSELMIGGQSIVDRLETTIQNIKFQNNEVMWDDMEKLEWILDILKLYQEKYEGIDNDK